MSTKITESSIETFAIELLEKNGYQYIYGPAIAPDSELPGRASFEADRSVITKHLKKIFSGNDLSEDSVCANFAHTSGLLSNYRGILSSSNKGIFHA